MNAKELENRKLIRRLYAERGIEVDYVDIHEYAVMEAYHRAKVEAVTDEQSAKAARDRAGGMWSLHETGFIEGAKWIRDKLLNQ